MERKKKPPLLEREAFWINVDRLTALVLIGPFTRWTVQAQSHFNQEPAHDRWLRVVLAVAMCLPVATRRRHAFPSLGVMLVVACAMTASGITVVSGPLLPVALVLFTVAATRPARTSVIALGVSLVVLIGNIAATHFADLPWNNAAMINTALAIGVAWLCGYGVNQRRTYIEDTREHDVDQAVADERLRIARELHDVVAHSMSVIAVQAGFGRHVLATQPEEAGKALDIIHGTSRELLTELRGVLGVLRRSDPAVSLRPAPGLADLDELVNRTGDAGVGVDLRLTGERRDLPAGIDVAAFRIVQEALANVVRHADVPSCQVDVDFGEKELCIAVTDDGLSPHSAADAGHGIIGMRERVGLYGGEFSAARLPGRGFQVAARIPLPGSSG